MLKSEIVDSLHYKHKKLKHEDIENIVDIFIKKIVNYFDNFENKTIVDSGEGEFIFFETNNLIIALLKN